MVNRRSPLSRGEDLWRRFEHTWQTPPVFCDRVLPTFSAFRMGKGETATPTDGLVKQGLRFVRDFAGFAGVAGVRAAVLSGLAAAFEGVGLVLLVPLLSIVTASDDNPGWIKHAVTRLLAITGVETRNARLSVLLGIFAILIVVRALVAARRDTTLARLRIEFVEDARSRLARSLAAAPWLVVSRLQHARVTHLLSGDIQRIGNAAHFIVQFLTTLVLTAFQIGIAFLLAPALTAMALALIAIGTLGGFFMLGRAHAIGARLTRTGVALMDETTQFLGGLKLAAGQNRQADFVAEFETSLAALKQQQIAFTRQQAWSRLTATILTGLVGGFIVFVGLIVLHVTPAILIAMLLAFARISGPALQMSQSAQQFAYTLPAYAEVGALERDLSVPERHQPARSVAALAPGRIVFRDVTFRYPQARSSATGAVVGLNLVIEPASVVGVAGPTGAGKTTFADLLVALLEPQSGEVTVGGTPLRGSAAAAWREHVSYVAQDPYLFRDSIRRNLCWARPEANETDLWQALEIAGADALVRGMADGLDTVLGERGTLISGGERQRICLARAVLRRPWLFVLDEATSAIDVATERDILKRLVGLHPRPTMVIIAHRDESLSGCDRILHFADGRLAGGEPVRRRPAVV